MEDLSAEEDPSFYRRHGTSSWIETDKTKQKNVWSNSTAELTWICFSSFSSLQLLKISISKATVRLTLPQMLDAIKEFQPYVRNLANRTCKAELPPGAPSWDGSSACASSSSSGGEDWAAGTTPLLFAVLLSLIRSACKKKGMSLWKQIYRKARGICHIGFLNRCK